MTSPTGYVLFRLGDRTFATPLDEVLEIVRLVGLEPLPGTRPPMAGVITLRGVPLPVLDVRDRADRRDSDGDPAPGDVLVMTVNGDTVGVAVDAVTAVLAPHELPEAAEAGKALPSYVVGIRRRGDQPVMLVDVHRMLDLERATA